MKKVHVAVVGCVLLVLSACSTYRTYTMEVLRPAMVTPTTVSDKMLFINNTVSQPADVGHYYMGLNIEGRDTTYSIPTNVDTFVVLLKRFMAARIEKEGLIKSIEAFSALEEGISSKSRFGRNAYGRIDSLDSKQRAYFNKKTKVSILASLDGLLLESLEACVQEFDNSYPLKRWVFVRSFWTVFDGANDSLLVKFQRRDSLYWMVQGTAPGMTNKPLPSLESTLPELAEFLAGEVYRVFTPYWERIERFYYISGNIQLKLAADEMRVGNWDKAAEYWQYTYKNGAGLNPFKASVNMMLYCESHGDVDGALVWAKRAEVASKHDILSPAYYDWIAFKAWYRDLTLRQEEMERIIPYLR
jgi:hypothetical protein